MNKIVVYKEIEPGIFLAYRNSGENPFAKFLSPKRNQSKKWQIFYRNQKLDDPFNDGPNSSPKTMKLVLQELTFAINHSNDYQLGLSNEIS